MATIGDAVVGLPEGGPTSRDLVKQQLRIPGTDTRDDLELDDIVAAVNAEVRGWPVVVPVAGATAWPDNLARGATMLASRLWRRKNSPAGVEQFGSLGATYVMRTDPDIAMLLRLGSWASPEVG
jgi:hypothetical protein